MAIDVLMLQSSGAEMQPHTQKVLPATGALEAGEEPLGYCGMTAVTDVDHAN